MCHFVHLDNGLQKESLLKSYSVVSLTNKLLYGVDLQCSLSLLFWLLHTANVGQRFFQSTGVYKNPFILYEGYAVLKGPAQSFLIYFVINSSIQVWALL